MKVNVTQRVIDDRNVIVVDPLEMIGVIDFRKYIEAYDSEKCGHKCGGYVCEREKGHKGNHEDYVSDVYWKNGLIENLQEVKPWMVVVDTLKAEIDSLKLEKGKLVDDLLHIQPEKPKEVIKCANCKMEIYYKSYYGWIHSATKNDKCNEKDIADYLVAAPETCGDICSSYVCQREKGHKGNHESYNELRDVCWKNELAHNLLEIKSEKPKENLLISELIQRVPDETGVHIVISDELIIAIEKAFKDRPCKPIITKIEPKDRPKGYHDTDEFYQDDDAKEVSDAENVYINEQYAKRRAEIAIRNHENLVKIKTLIEEDVNAFEKISEIVKDY